MRVDIAASDRFADMVSSWGGGKKIGSTNLNTVYLMPILFVDDGIQGIVLIRRSKEGGPSTLKVLKLRYFLELIPLGFGVQNSRLASLLSILTAFLARLSFLYNYDKGHGLPE